MNGEKRQLTTDYIHSSRHRQAQARGCDDTGAVGPLRNSNEGRVWRPIWRPVWHAHANIGRVVFMMPPASQVMQRRCKATRASHSDYFGPPNRNREHRTLCLRRLTVWLLTLSGLNYASQGRSRLKFIHCERQRMRY